MVQSIPLFKAEGTGREGAGEVAPAAREGTGGFGPAAHRGVEDVALVRRGPGVGASPSRSAVPGGGGVGTGPSSVLAL